MTGSKHPEESSGRVRDELGERLETKMEDLKKANGQTVNSEKRSGATTEV